MDCENTLGRSRIAEIVPILEPHIRRTPVVRARGEDFGPGPVRLDFKLELLQSDGNTVAVQFE